MSRNQADLNIAQLNTDYVNIKSLVRPLFVFLQQNIEFNQRIKLHYYYWCFTRLETVFGNAESTTFLQSAELFLNEHWHLVRGTMLCPTALDDKLMVEFLIRLASCVDANNPLKVLMPTISLEPVSRNFPLLRALIKVAKDDEIDDVDELKLTLKPCSCRFEEIFNTKGDNPEIHDLDRRLIEALDSIDAEISSRHEISRATWDNLALVIKDTNDFISHLKGKNPEINSKIEENCELYNSNLSSLSIKFFPIHDTLCVLQTHILSDDGNSLIPIACLAADGFMETPHQPVFKPYDCSYERISENEFKRLVTHSEQTRAFYEAVKKCTDSLNQDNQNLKTQLNILCRKIAQEDAHGGRGSQEKVGELASTAIANFFEFYAQISEEQILQIPEELRSAITKLRDVSGEYKGDMVSRLETCAGSRREQIERAMRGHDSILAAISIDREFHHAQIVQSIRTRDELKTDLLRSLTRNSAGVVSYRNGLDNLSYNHHIFKVLDIPVSSELLKACIRNNLQLARILIDIREVDVNCINPEGFTPLIIACMEANLELVRILLNAQGINVNQATHQGSPLIIGCRIDNLELVQALLAAEEIDVNQSSPHGTPLTIACERGNLEMVVALLRVPGIDVNQVNAEGYTPLMIACKNNNLEIVQALLQVDGININRFDVDDYTPLMFACKNGNLEIVQALLRADEDYEDEDDVLMVNLPNYEGQTPLILACENGNSEIVQALLCVPGIDVNQANDEGSTPLIYACENGDLEIVQALLHFPEIDVNQLDSVNASPLIVACENGNSEIVQALLRVQGIDVNQEDSENFTPLIVACENGNSEIVQALLCVPGIDVNQASDEGSTPLIYACENGDLEIVQALLRVQGIDVNQANDEGSTPLIVACENGNSEIVQALLSVQEIEVHQVDNNGKTALNYAEEVNNLEIQALLSSLEPAAKARRF